MLDATDTTKQRQTAQTEALADTLSDLLDGNKRALTQWLHGTQAFTDEVLRISRSRTLLAIEAWSALLACRSPEQMGEQQRRFLAKALEQSAEELKTLAACDETALGCAAEMTQHAAGVQSELGLAGASAGRGKAA